MKRRGLLGLTLIAFFGISLSFNNCGGVGSSSQNTYHSSEMSYDSKVEALSQIHKSSLSSSFCADSKNYSCMDRIFSSAIPKNAVGKPELICAFMPDGTELCVDTTKYLFNTSSAKENCMENCTDNQFNRFETEEFECHLKLSLKADGIYPLIASESDLIHSLEKVYQSCLAIQKGNAK